MYSTSLLCAVTNWNCASTLSQQSYLNTIDPNQKDSDANMSQSHGPIDEHLESTPNCRLFILGGKGLSENEWRDTFGEYGTIKDMWVVKDKHSGEDKGVCYITFCKASEAFLAQEKLNGDRICGLSKPIKVVIASDKRDGNRRDDDEEVKFVRIFIKVPKDWTDSEIKDEFAQFGEVDHVHILKDHEKKENKGLAFVRYKRAHCAAVALEECDKSYKAMYATPSQKRSRDNDRDHDRDSRRGRDDDRNFRGSARQPLLNVGPSRDMMMGFGGGSQERSLEIMVSSALPQDHLHRLVDLFPGMEFCDLDRRSNIAFVRYAAPEQAAWAKEKLSGFEYPIGQRIGVRYATNTRDSRDFRSMGSSIPNSFSGNSFGGNAYDMARPVMSRGGDPYEVAGPTMSQGYETTDVIPDNLQSIVQTLQQATSALAAAGINVGGVGGGAGKVGDSRDSDEGAYVSYTNVTLPKRQSLARKEDSVEERLFLVSQPSAFSEDILCDLFCRFGHLIQVNWQPGKNFGYAKFASKESANKAVALLHGETVAGMLLKVIIADKPKANRGGDSDDFQDHKRHKDSSY